jgi:hypothetical protein
VRIAESQKLAAASEMAVVVVETDHAQLAFGRLIPGIAELEIGTSSDYLIAEQAAAADFWVPSHCSSDAATYYVAESAAEGWLVAGVADFAVRASLVRESSLKLESSKLMPKSSCWTQDFPMKSFPQPGLLHSLHTRHLLALPMDLAELIAFANFVAVGVAAAVAVAVDVGAAVVDVDVDAGTNAVAVAAAIAS